MLILIWLTAGALPSATAYAMASETSVSETAVHDGHAQHHAPVDVDGLTSHFSNCGSGKAGKTADDGATCCPSMCQTVDSIVPVVIFQDVTAGLHFVAAKLFGLTSIAVSLAERPPRTS